MEAVGAGAAAAGFAAGKPKSRSSKAVVVFFTGCGAGRAGAAPYGEGPV